MKEAISILKQPKCKTCGDSKEILINGMWGMMHKYNPCPDCQQPKDQPSSEFTKKVRLNLENWGTVLEIQEDVRVRTIVDWLKEACKIIGKSEASRKELLEACKIGLEKALGITNIANKVGIAPDTPGRREADKDIKQIEAAIAKAEKEGNNEI